MFPALSGYYRGMAPSTTRKSAKSKTAAKNEITETLAEFCDQVDAHLGRRTGLEEAVREYRASSDRLSCVGSGTEYRKKLNRMMAAAMGDADEVVVLGERVARRVSAPRVVVKVSSAAAKKGNPELWDRARVVRPRLNIVGDRTWTVQLPGFVPGAVDQVWDEINRRRAEAAAYTAAVDEARETINATLDACATVWDGTAVWTADGWKFGRTMTATYTESRFKELCEERGVRWRNFAEAVELPGREWFVSRGNADEDWESDEVDEIDGD